MNAAAVLTTTLDATALLQHLHAIEQRFDRRRDVRWGPRTLDLDLIAFGDQVVPDVATVRHWIDLPPDRQGVVAPDQLIVPHPRLQDRAFVLVPLCDIAPDWRHPVLGVTIREMLAACSDADKAGIKPI